MANEPIVLERVRELSWALFDDYINDDELALLDSLLLSDDQARHTYIDCAQLHADLITHFAAPASESAAKSGATPILGFLNAGTLPLDLQSPPAEDAAQ